MNDRLGETLYPLTHAQKRIWYNENLYPDTPVHNIGGYVKIKGKVSFDCLEKAINHLLQAHDGLRIRFQKVDEGGYQYISSYKEKKIPIFDFSTEIDALGCFEKWTQSEALKIIELESSDLFYFAFFKISDCENGYLIKVHHFIADDWSIKIMTKQIHERYLQIKDNTPFLIKTASSFLEYIMKETNYIESETFLEDQSFWLEKFKNIPKCSTEIRIGNLTGRRNIYKINTLLSQKIKIYCSKRKISLNVLFVSIYLIFLYKKSGECDLIIGTPIFNRSLKTEKEIVGMLTSTMPFRFNIDPQEDVEQLIQNVKIQLMKCYMHQRYPFDMLMQKLELRKHGCESLFDTCINYYNTRLDMALDGIQMENVEFYNEHSIYALQIIIKDWMDTGELSIEFDYKLCKYDSEDIDRLYEYIIHLIEGVTNSEVRKTCDISLASSECLKESINDYNDTDKKLPPGSTVVGLFESQVKKTPYNEAVICKEKRFNYREVNEKANQLARILFKSGVRPGMLIGLMVPQTIDIVIAILGILKIGGVYVPIDSNYPENRVKYIVKSANLKFVIIRGLPDTIICCGVTMVNLDNPDINLEITDDFPLISGQEDLAYVIYTSGSTGRPKGCMIDHLGLVNYIWWAKQNYMEDGRNVFPLYSSISFDLTVTSIFTPLIGGGSIKIYANNEYENVLSKIINDKDCTILKLTPAHLDLVRDIELKESSLKCIIVGGEELKTFLAYEIYKKFNGKIKLFNEYGPTETVVGCMIHQYNPDQDLQNTVPVGAPIHNMKIYILDHDLKPVSRDMVGEIYIGGIGVSNGYINDRESTEKFFLKNPFSKGMLYKSGDLGMFIDDHTLTFCGRVDDQIKLNGYRIEAGEVEHMLSKHASVKHCSLVKKENHLCIYYVAQGNVSEEELRSHLKFYLPDYMIPDFFVEVTEIPLTMNGKVCKDSLIDPVKTKKMVRNLKTDFNEKEHILCRVLEEILDTKIDSNDESFFYLGGDSIKAIQLTSKLKKIGWMLKVKDILSNPIIRDMVSYLELSDSSDAEFLHADKTILKTPIIQWFLEQDFPNYNYYNQSILLDMLKDIPEKVLENIFGQVVKNHKIFGLNYNSKKESFYYNEKLLENIKLEQHDLSHLENFDKMKKMEVIAKRIHSEFDISKDILIRGILFYLGSGKRQLYIVAHHLAVDGVSWRIFLDDLSGGIHAWSNNEPIKEINKTSSYQKWSINLREYGKRIGEQEENYWSEIENVPFFLKSDLDCCEDELNNCNTYIISLNERETDALLTKVTGLYGASPRDILITALAAAIKTHTGNAKMVIELEGHGREEISPFVDVSRTIGWFTTMFPVVLTLEAEEVKTQVLAIRDQLNKIPNNGIGYGILKYHKSCFKDREEKLIRFNYLGEFSMPVGNHFKLAEGQFFFDNSEENFLTALLDINCLVINHNLEIRIVYSKKRFSESFIKQFGDNIKNYLTNIIYESNRYEKSVLDASDFPFVNLLRQDIIALFKD